MSKRREKTPKEFLGVPRCTNLQPLWSGVLTLMRPCFPNSSSGKTWRDPFVSHSANRAPVYHAHVSLMRGFEIKSSQVKSSQVKSSQVSPNARRRAQCKGGGGKEKKYMYTKKCQTLYHLQASLRERRRNNYIELKSRKHGKRESHRATFLATISQLPTALYLQNISNFMSQVCCGRPRGGYVGRGCHASVLLTQAGKFAM